MSDPTITPPAASTEVATPAVAVPVVAAVPPPVASPVVPPAAPVAFERFAWMVSPPASTFVPADGPGAWLMSIVPTPAHGPQRATNPPVREGPRGF